MLGASQRTEAQVPHRQMRNAQFYSESQMSELRPFNTAFFVCSMATVCSCPLFQYELVRGLRECRPSYFVRSTDDFKNEICTVYYNNIYVSPLTVNCPEHLSSGILSEGDGDVVTDMSNIVLFIMVE